MSNDECRHKTKASSVTERVELKAHDQSVYNHPNRQPIPHYRTRTKNLGRGGSLENAGRSAMDRTRVDKLGTISVTRKVHEIV